MMLFMLVISVVVLVLLILVAAVQPEHTTLSTFELERRKEKGDAEAAQTARREQLLFDIESLFRVAAALLLVLFVLLSVATFGWLLGVIIGVVVALEYGTIARLDFFQHLANKLYRKYEAHLLHFSERYKGALKFVRNAFPITQPTAKLESREELLHLVNNAGSILSADEKKLVVHGLTFSDRQVREIMTPRGIIDTISSKEILGPLILDDLHKTGHSRFPVIDGDLDHVVGVLHIQDLLVIDSGRGSTTVAKAMEPRVFYIREDHTLKQALAAFLRTRHHLFIVINEFRETVGVLSLEDVIEALLGHQIVDEFDSHEDLRAVAARNPRGNNHPKKHEDV